MQHDSYAEARIRDATLASAPYGMFICGADGSFECVNSAFEKLTGFAASELVGRRSFESLHDRAELAQRSAEWPALSSITTRYEGEWTYVRRNQSRVRVVFALAPIASSMPPDASIASAAHCDAARYVGIAIDMTRYAQSEARLWYVSHHDGVTRLPNQTLFTERLDLTIARCQRSGAVSLC